MRQHISISVFILIDAVVVNIAVLLPWGESCIVPPSNRVVHNRNTILGISFILQRFVLLWIILIISGHYIIQLVLSSTVCQVSPVVKVPLIVVNSLIIELLVNILNFNVDIWKPVLGSLQRRILLKKECLQVWFGVVHCLIGVAVRYISSGSHSRFWLFL